VGRPPLAAVEEFKTAVAKTGPPDAKGRPTECLRDRVARSRAIAADVWHFAATADLVVIEGLFTAQNAGKLIDRAATWMRIVDRCISADVPVAVIAPAALKLPIAGSGSASKTEMISALMRLWPDLALHSDNEVDAISCAHLGAVALGWDVPTLERHRKVTWTEFPDITSAGASVA
jgi:Holliday junction resolvasome RuvABC endonuclease subunit